MERFQGVVRALLVPHNAPYALMSIKKIIDIQDRQVSLLLQQFTLIFVLLLLFSKATQKLPDSLDDRATITTTIMQKDIRSYTE